MKAITILNRYYFNILTLKKRFSRKEKKSLHAKPQKVLGVFCPGTFCGFA